MIVTQIYYTNLIHYFRAHYHEYKNLYKKVALNPGYTELRLDLARAEDNLPLSSIVIAREHGKIEVSNIILGEGEHLE